ncbi:MAG: DUF2225 domain-containing protein [Lachnospiraceae bacterium]|nr:DUF2225 domain-containing protein [Lachnospiraceae bacterium]
MGLLSGLEKFGFKSLDKVDLYEEEKKETEKSTTARRVQNNTANKTLAELTEPEMLFEKSYTCPVCEQELKVKTMRQGKAKLLGTEVDMRPTYQNIDSVKYGAILCTNCGYAALTSYFGQLSDSQIRLIEENITSKYSKSHKLDGDQYSYEEALEIHKMALLNAVVKRGKSSEKAFICLKLAWLLRGKAEFMEQEGKTGEEELAKIKEEEKEYLSEAYKGFITAIQTESSAKICGMDSATITYLCAALAYEIGEYEESQRMVSRIYAMPNATKRLKDKCIDLKEMIQEKTKNS